MKQFNLSQCSCYSQKRIFESDMNRTLSEEATVQASVNCLRTDMNRSIYGCRKEFKVSQIESSKDKLNREE